MIPVPPRGEDEEAALVYSAEETSWEVPARKGKLWLETAVFSCGR